MNFRRATFLIIALICAWALWPRDRAEIEDDADQVAQESAPAGKKHVIKVAPKYFYMPGNVPMGVGDPLEGLEIVARRYEALHPDVEIQYMGVPTLTREWLVTQVSAGLAPDIVDVNVEEVWQDAHKGWYIPLDDFLNQPSAYADPGGPGSEKWWDVMKYPAISRGVAAPDGSTYCIVHDMVETGIFYNKDIFRKLELKPPDDWIEFLEMQQKIENAGYIPMLAGVTGLADWGTDLIFDQLYREILPGIDLRLEPPERAGYLEGYLDWDELSFLYQKGFFTSKDPRYVDVWRTMKEWRQYMSRDINDRTSDGVNELVKLFVSQRGTMFWTGSWQVHQFQNDPSIEFDWDVFYLPPIPREYNRFAQGHEMVVIGGPGTQWVVTNSSISDTGTSGTSERLRRCIDFLQFLTTPENTDAIVNEVTCFLPNVKGVEPAPALEPFDEFLKRRYTTTKWQFTFDMRFNEIMLRMLELYLNDGISEEEYLDWMERNIEISVDRIERRKKLDFSELARRWEELAPLRADMKGLPPDAKR